MAIIKHESRCRIGVDWYDNEREALDAARRLYEEHDNPTIQAANIGFVQCGRDAALDMKDGDGNRVGFAVVTP